MKKFLVRVLLFLFVVFICATLLDWFLSSRLLKNRNRMFASWNQIYNDSTNYDLIINGSSRAWLQYNPIILDTILGTNSFNLGIDGSPINRQIIKYNKYIELHRNPKYLIQNIDFVTMAIRYGYEREQFFPYFIHDRNLIRDLDKYENFSLAEKYIPCHRYLGEDDVLLEALFEDNKGHVFEFLTKGYYGNNDRWNDSTFATIDSVICSCDTFALRLFIDFIKQTTKQTTKVLFVYAPIYVGVREKMVNEEQMFAMYDSIAEKFDIPILDYNDIPMCYDTTYFYNATHLNRIGAELFTTKLAHDIDSLGLLK